MAILFKINYFFLFATCLALNVSAQTEVKYGSNKEAGKYILVNGVNHYYETYGMGAPLLLIHGNGTGIVGWGEQIKFFSRKYKVYAIDCRGRGKTELGKDSLTYLQQTKDIAEFIRLMKMDSVYIVGKSDGGIIGLLLGIYYPQNIKKIVAFSANLTPDSTALYPQCVLDVKKERVHAEKMLALKDTSQNWYLIQQKNRMMEFQPNITAGELQKIKVPVLVMSCDRDLIREEHTYFIYKNIPNAGLAIISGETHYIPRQNPELFNLTVDKFLSQSFKGKSFKYRTK